MIGPTGVGKTEIARRLAKLANAPFIKVEATKFTEVGYVGKEVDSIIRDLTDSAIKMVRVGRLRKPLSRRRDGRRAYSRRADPTGKTTGDRLNSSLNLLLRVRHSAKTARRRAGR